MTAMIACLTLGTPTTYIIYVFICCHLYVAIVVIVFIYDLPATHWDDLKES